MSTIKPELIHIQTLNVYKASVNTTDEYLNVPKPIGDIRVKYAQDTAFNLKKSAVRIRLDVILEALDKQEQFIGLDALYGIEFHFIVDNLDDFIEDEGDTKKVKGLLGGTLMGIVYSTARGIIFDRTQGTFFRGVILPVIDPKDLISD